MSRTLARFIRPFRVLGIESSADDSAAAIVTSDRTVLANVVEKQHHIHVNDGGIHPLKAQDAHAIGIPTAIRKALQSSRLQMKDIDAIAYTRGPGMYGCLSVGVHAARAIAAANDIPIVGVHHMQAHALTPLLTETVPPEMPFLNLLVSGGHTMLVLATEASPFDYRFKILASSLDDSMGDAFDKTAKLLQIPWLEGQGPGPSLEQYAIPDPNSATYDKIPKFGHPVPKQLAFSFAGLKTRIQRETAKMFPNLKLRIPHDLARAMARRFQEAAVGHVVQKVGMALDMLANDPSLSSPIRTVVASGGVASNMYLRAKLADALNQRSCTQPIKLAFPPISMCTDNAAMIAWAGVLRLQRQEGVGDGFDEPIMKKWPIDQY